MNIRGALAKGNSDSVIYFCEYSHSPLEQDKIQELINTTAYENELFGDTIEILAIESKDEMKKDFRLVGLIFHNTDENTHTSILLDKYEDISMYLEEIVE